MPPFALLATLRKILVTYREADYAGVQQVADIAGLNVSTVWRFEQGANTGDWDGLVAAYGQVLGMAARDLWAEAFAECERDPSGERATAWQRGRELVREAGAPGAPATSDSLVSSDRQPTHTPVMPVPRAI